MNDIFDEDLQPVTPVQKRTISITSEPVTAILVKIDGGKRLYTSKKEARRKVAWRILYDTDRLDGERWRFDRNVTMSMKGWARKRMVCDCCEASHPYGGTFSGTVDSSGCEIHNRHDGYYKRLHQRIVRWLAKGYIAPESGLKDDSND